MAGGAAATQIYTLSEDFMHSADYYRRNPPKAATKLLLLTRHWGLAITQRISKSVIAVERTGWMGLNVMLCSGAGSRPLSRSFSFLGCDTCRDLVTAFYWGLFYLCQSWAWKRVLEVLRRKCKFHANCIRWYRCDATERVDRFPTFDDLFTQFLF